MSDDASSAAQPVTPKRQHRLLVLQASSVREAYGGIEYYLDDLLSLAIDVYGPGSAWAVIPRRHGAQATAWAPPYRYTEVPFRSNRLLRKLENRFSLRMLSEARAIASELKPTLVLSGHVSLGPLAYSLQRTTGVPYLTVAYGLEAWGNLLPQDEWCLARSKGILSISHWTKRVLVERGYLAGNVEIVQPMLPAHYERLPPPADRDRAPEKPFTLVSVSRLDASERYKGQDHVIEALFRIRASEPRIRLRYIVQGEGSDRPRLEALVRERELEDMVEFRPRVADRAELESLYREADLHVMASRFGRWQGRWRGEGFGIVYLEAAACGVPSVAYDCGGATDIIRRGQNGLLVEPDNIAELARTIASLARSPMKAIEMGKRAHQMVLRDFTRSTIRGQLVRALDKY